MTKPTLTASAAYPASRLRRTRTTGWSRAMVRENILTPADLIWPLFITTMRKCARVLSSISTAFEEVS